MITMPVYVLLLLLGLVALLSFMGGFITAALCRAAARDAAEYDANARMFAGADAIDGGDA